MWSLETLIRLNDKAQREWEEKQAKKESPKKAVA